MAKLTRMQREAKWEEARRLVSRGYTRRQVNSVLSEKYGEGIRPTLYTRLYHGKLTPAHRPATREATPSPSPEPYGFRIAPSGKRRFRPRRQSRYNLLIRNGMLPVEAYEFSKIPRMRDQLNPSRTSLVFPPALRKVVQERKELIRFVNKLAREYGWGREKRDAEVRKMIVADYRNIRKGIVDRMVRGRRKGVTISPWRLYDAVSDRLPEDMRWDTPRHASRSSGSVAKLNVAKKYREKALRADIRALQDEIKRTGDPSGRLESQLLSLQYNLKTGSF